MPPTWYVASLGCIISISLLADLSFLLFFLRIPKLRQGPGQLLLAQTQVQLLLTVVWFFVNTGSLVGFEVPYVCLIADFGMYGTYFYAAVMCVVISQRWEDYESSRWQWKYHLVALVPSITICLVTGPFEDFGSLHSSELCPLRAHNLTM